MHNNIVCACACIKCVRTCVCMCACVYEGVCLRACVWHMCACVRACICDVHVLACVHACNMLRVHTKCKESFKLSYLEMRSRHYFRHPKQSLHLYSIYIS